MIEPRYQAFLADYLGTNFYTQVLQPEILDLSKHYCRAKITWRPNLANSLGVFHGGVIYAFGDALVGIACRTEGGRAVTLSGDIHYLANRSSGDLYAETVLLHQGRNTGYYRVEFKDEGGRLLAHASYHMYFFPDDQPGGEIQPTRQPS